LFAESLKCENVVDQVTRLVVPRLADYCRIEVLEQDGIPRPLLAVQRRQDLPFNPEADPHAQSLSVPLIAHGRQMGNFIVAMSPYSKPLDDADLELVRELTRRTALVLDNARLLELTQRAVRARDEFLSIASHELKTPVTSLQLQLQLLKHLIETRGVDATAASTGQTVPSLAGKAEKQCGRITMLINNLLDISRISAKRLELNYEEIELGGLVREVISRFQDDLSEAGCEVTVQGPDFLVGDWDRLRTEQVITNLLSNAMKYGRGKPISVETQVQDNVVRIVVRDHGIGVAPEFQKKIFDRFERASASKNFKGLGLGLYIVKQIVNAHGGAIWVESRAGDGAAFIVEWPKRRLAGAKVTA
jgi:signal transduction histidine kinase